MLERVQEQQAAICAVLAENRDRSIRSLLSESEEWVIIEDFCKDLSPIVSTLKHGCVYETIKVELLSLAEVESDDRNKWRSTQEEEK